ncbi:MAG: penicillin-binding protein 2 [Cytophagales bacterium]|nr:penicillin-binding protein 2 [Cytophagales bacterium]
MKPTPKPSLHRHDRSVSFASSPLLASKTPLWRSKLILIAFGLAFVGLAARAAYVQVIHQDFYQRQGEIRFARTLEIPATRGRLLDRNDQILATNVPAFSVWAIPEDINESLKEHPEKLDALARILNMRVADLQQKLAQEDRLFVWLRRQLDSTAQASIQDLKLNGLHIRNESRRQYPEGETAATITGLLNSDGKGIEGLEMTFNADLSGKDGSRRVIKDRMGRVVEDVGEQVPPTNGRDVRLTIDNKIQFFAYQKLKEAVQENKAKGGSIVILDVQTNEVLALVNYDAHQGSVMRNRAVADSFEPGSVMKPLTIALALENRLVTPSTTFQTAPGYITITGAKITDSHAHGVLSVEQIVQKSSNVGTVKIAQRIPYADMWGFYSAIGLGQKPTLPFSGVVGGRLRPYKSWHPVEQATMSYGYGLSVSLFQLAQAYNTLANDGEMTAPHLIKTDQPAAKQRVISIANARAVRHMLHLATGSEGTAPKAQTEGYTVGGKTGTTHKQEGRGYAAKKYRSTFVGMAPIDMPRIVVAVTIDEPSNGKYFGGDVAAPVFSQTVGATLRLMGVMPDRNIKPQIAINAVEESI